MTKTLLTYNPTLMSPRTVKYVEAMIREGDHFNYDKWLKEVREEEAQAKQVATGTSGGLAPAQIAVPIETFDDQHLGPTPALSLTAKATLARALRRLHRQAKSQTRKAKLRRWLEKVQRGWSEFQGSRERDGVYKFLTAVFDLVMHFRVRRRTRRLLRHAFEFANFSVDKSADAFSTVIRCASGGGVDNKTISKWSRALRYAAAAKRQRTSLKRFIKKMGGINACASLYARRPHKH